MPASKLKARDNDDRHQLRDETAAPSTVEGFEQGFRSAAANKPSAITTFTKGPATAMIIPGPVPLAFVQVAPLAQWVANVISGVLIPNALAANACPNSCRHHAKKKKQNKYHAARRHGGTALRIIAERQPDDISRKRNVNPQLDAGDAKDWERPAHANQLLCYYIARQCVKPDCGMDHTEGIQ
jgi:hypothetical protein